MTSVCRENICQQNVSGVVILEGFLSPKLYYRSAAERLLQLIAYEYSLWMVFVIVMQIKFRM